MKALTHFPTATTLILGLGLLIAQGPTTFAQTSDDNRSPVTDNADQSIVSTIAPYRDDVRGSILLVSQHPEILTELARQQAASQEAFNELIQSYGQTRQGWFYDISRFPNVLHELATLPKGASQATVTDVTKALPADIQESAWKLYHNHHNDLLKTDNLNQQADQSFAALVAPLDSQTQNAFQQLIGMPDVLTLLTQQIDKMAELGKAYRNDPKGVTQSLADAHANQEAQNQQELADYQRELSQDPQAQQELQQAGQAYAQANGYSTNGINPNPAWANTGNYYQNPYSYWSGYPSWYASPLWYPSAFGVGTGFYYGARGNLVVYGLPSIGFSSWFFNRGYAYYPHLYNRFNTYYTRNVGFHRTWSPVNTGFITAAHRVLGSANGTLENRANWLTTPRTYSRPSGLTDANARMATPMNRYPNATNSIGRSQSWGGGFSGTRSYGGSFGGGMHSFGGGGGFRGGRR